jgi:hypothetical protein
MRVDEHNTFEVQLDRYRVALDLLQAAGGKVTPTSRLRGYERLIQGLLDNPSPAVDAELVYRAAFALREVDEIIEITEHLPSKPEAELNTLLARIPGGTDNPDDEPTASAREAQYEAYLGTVFRRAGMPTEHGKPDLTVRYDGMDYYVEAKRPGSARRVDDRVRSAVHQLRDAPRAGVIALSLDQVIRPKRSMMSAPTFDAIAPDVARLVNEFVLAHSHLWRNRLTSEPVDAVLLTARLPARLEQTGHLVTGTNIHLEPISQVSPEVAMFLEAALGAYMQSQQGRAL